MFSLDDHSKNSSFYYLPFFVSWLYSCSVWILYHQIVSSYIRWGRGCGCVSWWAVYHRPQKLEVMLNHKTRLNKTSFKIAVIWQSCRKDYIVHPTIYYHGLIKTLISSMYHSPFVCHNHSLHTCFHFRKVNMKTTYERWFLSRFFKLLNIWHNRLLSFSELSGEIEDGWIYVKAVLWIPYSNKKQF